MTSIKVGRHIKIEPFKVNKQKDKQKEKDKPSINKK